MNELWFALILFLSAVGAGLLGALSGLGGGVVIVPLLTVVFHVDIHYAIGASLVSVIATSSGAAAAYVREGFSNIRVGMFLEIATTLGALVGAWLTTRVPTKAIGIIFGLVLLYSAWASLRKMHETFTEKADALALRLRLQGELPTHDGAQPYVAQRVPAGFGLMWIAGALSGLLGIGSGAVKVLAMDQAMRLPFKVSTTTSNFMIGVTAAASAGLYWRSGYLVPSLVFPVMLGVLGGSLIGSRVLVKAQVRTLKLVFSLLIVAMGIEMIVNNVVARSMSWNDKRLETVVGVMLRTGVMLAAAVVVTGGVLYLFQNHGPRRDYRQFHGMPARLIDLGSIVHGVAAFDARSIIMLGLLVLIATPVARVAMCIVGFLFERDKLYVAVSTIVFAILIYSLFFHT